MAGARVLYCHKVNRRTLTGTSAAMALYGTWKSLSGQATDYVVAETAYGKVRGISSRGIRTFKGIHYGASTAGKNRFPPAVAPEKWPGVLDALEFGPDAPNTVSVEPRRSQGDLGFRGAALPRKDEACLVLNVWTPGIREGWKRPVMVWLHGGGFSGGSAAYPITDGTNLADRGDVVVVSVTHRLNVLGFLYLGDFDPAFPLPEPQACWTL
jgi:para-nitrobenzyl esterase